MTEDQSTERTAEQSPNQHPERPVADPPATDTPHDDAVDSENRHTTMASAGGRGRQDTTGKASERLWEVFWEASERPSDEQDAYVRQAIGDDEQLANQVLAMLEVSRSQPDFLEMPAAVAAGSLLHNMTDAEAETALRYGLAETVSDTFVRSPPVPERIGKFRIIRVLGHGGMGVVYEAEQERPLRRVALKIIRPEVTTPQHIRRFEFEADVLGRLRHPGIAQIYEAGTEDEGFGPQPYFVMEFVDGRPLLEYAGKAELTVEQRLELMIRICEAVHHAHQQGVIHRDLKPANILITPEGEPKVLDFGVARVVGQDTHLASLRTEHGQLLGTLPYMSPEQVAGDSREIDTRADVYALGVVMYQLLSGRLPYEVMNRMIFDAMRVIREQPPQPLSTLNRTLRGDIDTIVSKALDKDKRRRYQSAAELGNDIRRHLNHELIEARPATTWDQLVKFTQRNRALVGGVAASFLILTLGVLTTTWAAQVATRERREAERSTAEAQFTAYVSDLIAASALFDLERPIAARQRLMSSPEELRSWEWRHLQSRGDDSIGTLADVTVRIGELAADTEGRFFALTMGEKRNAVARVVDRADGAVLFESEVTPVGRKTIALDPAGDVLAVVIDLHVVRLFSTRDWRSLGTIEVDDYSINAVAWSADGGALLISARIGDNPYTPFMVRWWNPETLDEIVELARSVPAADAFALTADESSLIVADFRDLIVHDLAGGGTRQIEDAHAQRLMHIEVAPDGRSVLTCSHDRYARLWSWPELEIEQEFGPFNSAVMTGIFDSENDSVILGTGDGEIAIFDRQSGDRTASLRGHSMPIARLMFDAREDTLISASWDGTIRAWNPAVTSEVRTIETGMPYVLAARFVGPEGRQIVGVGSEPALHVWNADDLTQITTLTGHDFDISEVVTTRDGRYAVTASSDGTARVWDLADGSDVAAPVAMSDNIIVSVDVDPAGRRIVWAAADTRTFGICDLLTGDNPIILEDEPVGSGRAVAFSADGRFVATAGDDSVVRIWDAATGEQRGAFLTGAAPGYALAFHPVQPLIVAGGQTGELFGYDYSRDALVFRFVATTGSILKLDFNSDGTRLAGATSEAFIRLWAWHNDELRELVDLRGHGDGVFHVSWDARGERLVSASVDGTLRVWEATSAVTRWERAEAIRAARSEVAVDETGTIIGPDGIEDPVLTPYPDAIQDAMNEERLRMGGERQATLFEQAAILRDRVLAEWILPEHARTAIASDRTLSADVRAYAMRLIDMQRAHAPLALANCWTTVADPNLPEERYTRVLTAADWFITETRYGDAFMAVKASAEFRLGRFESARNGLASHIQLIEEFGTAQGAAEHAVYAMTLAHLHAWDEAQAALARSAELLAASMDVEFESIERRFHEEAASLLSAMLPEAADGL